MSALSSRVLWVGVDGTRLDASTARMLKKLQPAGVVLFKRNLDKPENCARLLRDIRAALPCEPLLALDQEGGPVSRLRAFGFSFPSAHAMARTESRRLMRRHAELTGTALRMLGFNVDFAPVVDLCAPDAGNGIGERSFSLQPGETAAWAALYLRELRRQGVLGCLKHFPGLGRTRRDSHRVLPAVRAPAAALRRDMAPFKKLRREAPMVMVGHGWYPALMKKRLPATLDPGMVEGILRRRWGYRGLAVADDLAMLAVPAWAREKKPDAFLRAGCDTLLACEPGMVEPLARVLEKREKEAAPFLAGALKRIAALQGRAAAMRRGENFSSRLFGALVKDSLRLAAEVETAG